MVSPSASFKFITELALTCNSKLPVLLSIVPALPECVICKSEPSPIFKTAPSSNKCKSPLAVGFLNLYAIDSYVKVAIIYS